MFLTSCDFRLLELKYFHLKTVLYRNCYISVYQVQACTFHCRTGQGIGVKEVTYSESQQTEKLVG